MATVHFDFTNTDDHAIVAQAVPNIAPAIAARYLRKTECFCFNNQAFARSEEHTSELQSLMRISYAVFCLKKKHTYHTHQLGHTRPHVTKPHLINKTPTIFTKLCK